MNPTVNKYLNDPKWKDIMVLYSGLFEDENERENFILDVNKSDLALATNCELAGLNQNQKVTNEIEKKAFDNLIHFHNSDNFEIGCDSFNTLLSLEIKFDFLSYYKNPEGFQIKFLKNKISNIFNKSNFQKVDFLIDILKSNQKYFIIDLFHVISETSFLTINEQLSFINSLDINNIKINQFELVVNIFPKEVLKQAVWNKDDLKVICAKSNNFNFINTIIKFSNNSLKLKDIIDLKFQKIEKIWDCYFLYEFLKENNLFFKTYGSKIIDTLLESGNEIHKIFSLILIKFGYDNSNLYKAEKKSNLYKKIVFKNFNLEQSFYKNFQKLLDENKKESFVLSAENYIGRKYSSKISNIHKYHYFIHDKFEVYIPFKEVVTPLKIGDLVRYIILYFDRKNNRFIGSIKQINSKPGNLKFDFDYLNTIKIGDIYDCKIVKINNRFSIKIYGIKKNINIKIINPSFEYIEYENRYQAKIVSIIASNFISVLISKL
jgi:hypothetical protein